MAQTVKIGGEICTVIDEGLLNTEQASPFRKYLLEHMILRGVVRLPDTTFKPNKINVKSSVLHFVRREATNADLDHEYPVFFLDVESLGYHGSGEAIRNLNFQDTISQMSIEYHGTGRDTINSQRKGNGWRWFTRSSLDLCVDATSRFDFKYWDPALTDRLKALESGGTETVKAINCVKTRRGKSPSAALYVDEADGYALVVKAGTNITKQGKISFDGDYIEKNVYDEMETVHVKNGDVLLSSTGDGTLGKCAVYRSDTPAIFDGHVTLIRCDQSKVYPEYLCDYLRAGFGAEQIARLFTGSTGLIELPPEQVDRIFVPLPDLGIQQKLSDDLRAAETSFTSKVGDANVKLREAQDKFRLAV